MLKIARLWLPLLIALPCIAQQIRYAPVPRDIVETRLRNAPRKDADREALVKALFTEAGCAQDRLSEQKVSGEKLPNIICVVPGQTPEEIIVGAHFDHVSLGAGVVDNWSGASLLPSLLQAVSDTPRQHTFVFIAFTAEEKGLVGSQFYAKHMSADEKNKLKAMINLDSLGLTPTKIWVTQADPKLVSALARTASALKLPVSEMDVDGVGSADSISFKNAKVPSITIHSVTQKTLGVLHSSGDQLSAIRIDDYYQTYSLLSAYLAYLDSALSVSPTNDTKPTSVGTH
jgi:Zn-dependent M28 family amino/carboxypeptidase